MASLNNVPKDILDSMRGCLDRRVKLSIKRLVHYSLKKDKIEKRVLAFSSHRLYVFTAKSAKDVKKEFDFHYLDIKAIESKRPNQLVITTSLMNNKSLTFTTLEADTDEVDHMITHIGTSLKTVFPAYPLERLIKTIEVQPSSRLNLMHDLINTIEQKETGPCGGYTLMYSCMCDFHFLPYRDEVAWDVDTIYLSQDSRELCLRDFDHLKERDLVPIVSALVHNTWFTSLNANNVKLNTDVCTEVLRVMKKNAVIEALLLSNTGITTDFIKKLSTITMSDAQLHKLDLSNNPIEDEGAEHIFGALSSRGRRVTWLDLSKTRITSKGVNKISEMMSKSPHVFNTLQTLVLAGLTSGNKADDLQNLYIFLASPNNLSHLDLSGTDIELDKLMAPLQRGCSQNISELKLARTTFSNKKSKDVVVQASFKQFFASVFALKHLDLSGAKLPADAIKDLLLGISSNRNIKNVHLDISGMDLPGQAAQFLQNCLTKNVSSLNISNIGFLDTDLIFVLNSIGTTKQVRKLSIGGVFKNIKLKNIKTVMEQLVDIIQDEESMIESLSLADSKLKDSMNMIINALGSNTTLTEIDISGNLMGDLGARMLSKALQINNKLKTIYWDKNNTTSQGFEDVAEALEKNFTLKKMPMPVFDASVSPEKNEQALQRIERLLQRNHSPQKYSSDQAYRLQQGFLISSTQQMVDRLVVQSQDTINALDSMNALQPCSGDIEKAKALIKDADNSKTLLPRLRDIAIQSQNTSSPVAAKLKEISAELTKVLESQMKKTVEDMLEATRQQCKAMMKDEAFLQDLQSGCGEKSSLPKDFTTNILNDVDTGIFNELSELNLAVAAHVSDRVIEEVIDRLSLTHKTLTNHLNERKKDAGRKSQVTETKKEDPNEPNLRSKSPQDSPKMKDKRKSMHARKIRPQSVIDDLNDYSSDDREHVQLALDAERKRPTTVPQATRSGSRSPKNRSPKPLRANDRSKEKENLNAVKTPKMAPRSLKPGSRSPSVSPRSTSPVPSISVTFTNVGDLSTGQEHIYDNAVPESRLRKHHDAKRDLQDGLEGPPGPNIPSKPLPSSATLPDLQNIEVNPDAPKLTHPSKDRARRPKNVRPTTRQSEMPRTRSENTIKVDESVDDFFAKPSSPAITSISEKKEETSSNKSSSTKSTPESKKKLGGIFNFGHKDKEHKDTKTKESKKGGLLSRLHSSPKSSPSPKHKRVSDVQEEPDDSSSSNNVLSRSTKETPSPRGSMDKKGEKPKNEQTANVPKATAENVSLSGSLGKKSDKSDTSSEKSVESLSLSTKSDKSSSLDRKSNNSRDKSPVIVEEKAEKSKDSDKAESESGSESEAEEVTKKEAGKENNEVENGDVKKEVKAPLQPPRTKRSFSKADAKKETASVETGKDIAEEKEDDKAEKENKETEEDTNDKTIDKVNDKEEDEVKEESKEDESEKEKEEEADKVDENKPLSTSKKPGVPGGIGFGMNIMADLKAKQEKRRSQMPSKPAVSEKTESQSSATEEKKSPFGLHSLKPVSKTVPKENNNLPVKPSDNKSSSDSVKKTAEVPSLKSRPGSGGSADSKIATPSPKPDVNVAKKNSLRETVGDKPSVTPRPAGVNKPPPPTRPKPPIAGNKPTPAPRKSISSSDSTENEEDKKPVESGVVYDSATLKMSVKDKISKFKSPGNESEAGKGRPLSQSEKKEHVGLRDSKKNDSLPINTEDVSTKKSSSLPRNTTPADMKKGETTEAGDLDLRNITDAMTDSGIVDDSPKTSVKDAMSKFDNDEVGLRKHGSLPRHGKQIDSLKGDSDSPKRPQSMFAAMGTRPDSKKQVEKKEEIAEENDKDSPTEEIILV